MRTSATAVARSPLAQALALLAAVVLLGALASGSTYWLGLLTTGTILYILTASLNLIFGYAGLFALCQQGLYAVGAYVSVLIGIHLSSLPWIVDIVAGMAAAGLAGYLLALPTARLRGEYLALATIAFGIGVEAILIAWIGVTGGPGGLPDVPTASIFGSQVLPNTEGFLWICGVSAAFTFLFGTWMVKSRLGRAVRALRDNPLASQSVGINPVVTRSIVFAASGAMAGLAGGLFAAQQLIVEPGQFNFTLLIGVLVAVLVGGPGRSFGPIVGAAVLVILERVTNGLGSLEGVVYAGLLAVIILTFRDGLVGVAISAARMFKIGSGPRAAANSPVTHAARGATSTSAAGSTSRAVSPTRSRNRTLALMGVSLQFGGVMAVNDVSITIDRGEVLGLIGPNGAGKTSLVNVATGVLRPTQGNVSIGAERITGLSAHGVSRRGITRTFQHPQLSPGLTVLENVMLGLDRAATATMGEAILHLPRSRADERRFMTQAMELLESVGISRYARTSAGSVPYGVQRRMEVARALACSPDFIFLDEAGAGLSDEERGELVEAIKQVGADSGPGIIVIEHNIAFVRQLCPRTVVLVGGSVLIAGDTDDVLHDPRVIDAYLGEPIGDASKASQAFEETSRG